MNLWINLIDSLIYLDFWNTPGSVQVLLLALCSGISPTAQGIIGMPGIEPVSFMENKQHNYCTGLYSVSDNLIHKK